MLAGPLGSSYDSRMAATRRWWGGAATAAAAVWIGAAGCGPTPPVAVATANSCAPPAGPVVSLPDTIVLGDSPSVRLEGGAVISPITRFLESLLGVPLVRIDCRGEPIPALATEWRPNPTAETWTFQLADRSVDPAAIRAQWRERATAGGDWPWSEIVDVSSGGGNRLVVRLRRPFLTLPTAFADPALAVAVPTLGMVARIAAPSADERNVLDPGSSTAVDLLFSRDPATIEYARGRPEWRVVPLPPDRRYHLLTPVPVVEPPAVGASLIEAVRGDASEPAGPAWWSTGDCDGRPDAPLPPGPPRAEIGFLAGDPVARALAERMVALGIPPTPPPTRLRAVPLDSSALAAAINEGRVAAAVVADPTEAPLGCLPRPWSTHARFRYPLLETRAHLIVRRDLGPLTVDRDGTARFLIPGRP